MGKKGYGRDGVFRSLKPPLVLPGDTDLSLAQFLFDRTSSSSSKPAITEADSSLTLSFSELRSIVINVAHGLHRMGICRNDVVLLLSHNCYLYLVCFLAVTYIGAIATTANPVNTAKELSKQVKDCNPKMVITVPELWNKVRDMKLPTVFLEGENIPSEIDSRVKTFLNVIQLGHRSSDRPVSEVKQSDVACILYSSGTTGLSKGVVLTHRNFIATSLAFTIEQATSGEVDRVYSCFLPMFHVFGLSIINYCQLVCGNSIVTMKKFEMESFLCAVEMYKVTDVCAVPPVILALVKQKSEIKHDLSSLRKIISGAAPLGKELMDECALAFPQATVLQGYGMTETCGIISVDFSVSNRRRTGSVGGLVAGVEAKIVSIDSLKPLGPNEKGEIWVRGPNVMRGYLNNAQATEQAIDGEGWLRTGDLGYFDDDGCLYIADRIKELIKYKGYQVAPAELEGILLSNAGILDAAVIPYPNEEAGEVPAAYVVRRDDCLLTEDVVKAFVNDQVAPYKRLRHVFFIKVVPKSASGKILRKELIRKVRSKI